jgi:hypothetical protein
LSACPRIVFDREAKLPEGLGAIVEFTELQEKAKLMLKTSWRLKARFPKVSEVR